MRLDKLALITCALALTALGTSCDKSSEGDSTKTTKTTATTAGGAGQELLDPTEAPFASELKAAGFKTVLFRRFPSQTPGKKASVLVYRSTSDRKRGGFMYVQNYSGVEERMVWHWYFEKAAPDSVQAVEINEDGLWDMIVFMNNGKTEQFIQDETFTLGAPERDDVIAMNGGSSDGATMWQCFDGDSLTAWRASIDRGDAFVDVPTPLGVKDRILSVQLLPRDRAEKCEIEVDGKKVQEFKLEQTTGMQLIQLDAATEGAKSIRLVVKSGYDGNAIAIGEVGIR